MTLLEDLTARSAAPAEEPAMTDDPVAVQETEEPVDTDRDIEPLPRPTGKAVGVTFLSGTAAALSAGGVFGSWAARGFAVGSLIIGIGWACIVVTRPARRVLWQLVVLPLIALLASASVLVGTGGESPLTLMRKAVESGRALSIPVPFDPGWRPVLIALFVTLGFATAWVATRMQRPQTALVIPLPLIGVLLISQPSDGQILAGFMVLVPLLGAATLLFGGHGARDDLGREFELKRLVRSIGLAIPLLLAVVLLAQTSFLFPKPVYDPTHKPQKPKSIPLSAARDRVLFEVDGPLTGPWPIGALDVYDGSDWRLAPFDASRLRRLPGNGVVDSKRGTDINISFTTRDLGNTSTFPGTAMPAKGIFPGGPAVLFDPRTETFRIKDGRLPLNYTYSVQLQAYPTEQLLRQASDEVPPEMREFLAIPPPPPAVQAMLDNAVPNRYDRLNALRAKLNDVVIASGSGIPAPVPPSRVQQLLAGNHEGTPFEIVAAEAMLARWAGVPSRIGFGFDAGRRETIGGREVTTIRPKDAAQFLEVWFAGYGWIPLVSTPPKAKTSLDADPNKTFKPTVTPSDDVAVQLVIPLKAESLTFIYDAIRSILLRAVPIILLLLAVFISVPALQKWRRTNRRRRWASERGPRHEIVAAYAEFRDAATDLSVGDPIDSPLEYRARVVPDVEHDELAWLVSRVLYGDMGGTIGPEDARAAWELSASLRKRLTRAQPRQTQILAALSRASILEPYTTEVPNISPLVLRRPRLSALRRA